MILSLKRSILEQSGIGNKVREKKRQNPSAPVSVQIHKPIIFGPSVPLWILCD